LIQIVCHRIYRGQWALVQFWLPLRRVHVADDTGVRVLVSRRRRHMARSTTFTLSAHRLLRHGDRMLSSVVHTAYHQLLMDHVRDRTQTIVVGQPI
jgi:hypothetical protein